MKKIISICMIFTLLLGLPACGTAQQDTSSGTTQGISAEQEAALPSEIGSGESEGEELTMKEEPKENTDNFETNILVVYFSATGTTKPLANGGGQPQQPGHVRNTEDIRALRAKVLYDLDILTSAGEQIPLSCF